MISTLLYRMAARTVANAVVQDAAAELSPLQLGIATPGALEAAIHTLRETLRNDPELAALLLDIQNAFNEISRSEMINYQRPHLISRSAPRGSSCIAALCLRFPEGIDQIATGWGRQRENRCISRRYQ